MRVYPLIPVVQSELCIHFFLFISFCEVYHSAALARILFIRLPWLLVGMPNFVLQPKLDACIWVEHLEGNSSKGQQVIQDSLLSEDLLSLFITFSVEKLLSSFPLVIGREKRSWASTKRLWRSPALGHETTSTRLYGNRVLPGKWNWWHIAASQETLFKVGWGLPSSY